MAGIVENMEHLGDGAYAEVEEDGGVWLAANHHDNRVVHLDAHAMDVLRRFYTRKTDEFRFKRKG